MTRPTTTTSPIAAITFFHGRTCCWRGLFLGVGCWHGGGTCHSRGVSTARAGRCGNVLRFSTTRQPVAQGPVICLNSAPRPFMSSLGPVSVSPLERLLLAVSPLGCGLLAWWRPSRALPFPARAWRWEAPGKWNLHQGGGCGSPMGALKNALQDVGPWFWRLPGGAHQWRPGQGR